MSVFVGSRYANASFVEIIQGDRKKKFVAPFLGLNKENLKGRFSIHTVRTREELDSIAFNFGINPTQYWIIQDLNDIMFAFDIKPLQQLVVPDVEALNDL